MKGLKTICGLLLAACIFTSCDEELTLTNYLFDFREGQGFTQDHDIPDPEVRAFYISMWEDFAGLRLYDLWQIDVKNRKFDPQDEKALAQYNRNLILLKEMEAKYRKKIAELGEHEGSPFHITYIYRLSRSVPAGDYSRPSPWIMQEYSFELRYN